MKKSASLITYISALVIGILLLALHEKVELVKGMVIAMGVLITIPSAIMFFSSFISKKNVDGSVSYPAWYTVVVACAGLVLGIWMLVMPGAFESWMVYTLGVILILVGAAQIVFFYNASRPFGANPLWYCVPVLAIAGGFIIIFLGPIGMNTWATIVAGVTLIVYAVNGISAWGRERKVDHDRKLEGIVTDDGELSD